MICSLATVEAIADTTGLPTQIKWPNDVMMDGKKLGGLLTELGLDAGRLDYVAVGMGINVNLDVSTLPALATPAASISAALGHGVSRLDLLVSLLQSIETRYDKMSAGWSPHAEWRQHLATLGEQVRVETPQETVEGVAEGVDQDGALLVRTKDGILCRVLVGDVTLRNRPST